MPTASPPRLPSDTVVTERDDVLRCDLAHATVWLRVDDGATFVRWTGAPHGDGWQAAPLPWVMTLFTDESPAAAFLRRQGVQPLKQLLVDVTGGAATDDSAAGGA